MVGTEPVFIASMSSSETDRKLNTLYLESYGVRVRIESNNKRLFNDARRQTEHALVGNFRIIDPVETPHVFRLEREEGGYSQVKNGEKSGVNKSRKVLLRYFDSMLRITIAEYAVGHVFLHAGVVGWKGRAIVIPGDSYSGKSTLVAELVKAGAEYYSDEYAVLDERGLVYPFARRLSMRTEPGKGKSIDNIYITAEELGGRVGSTGIAVGWVLLTTFENNAQWNPKVLSSGKGVLEMLSQTIPIRYAPEFSLKVLKKVATHAIILKSPRFDASAFAKFFLDFVDNKAF